MTNNLNFIWIDDSTEREKDSENLKAHFDSISVPITMQFVLLDNTKVVDEEINKILENTEPDLIILDHSLTKSNSTTYKTGSLVANYIHEKWPGCPIISCTAVNLADFDLRTGKAYENIFESNRISSHYDTILAIANGFKSLKSQQSQPDDLFLNSLSVPEADLLKVKKVIPLEFLQQVNDNGLYSDWYKWCNSVLFSRPGFLYDMKHTATLLGLTLEGFQTIKHRFCGALYTGIFSTESNPRWWKSQVLNILSEITEEINTPWILGRKLTDNTTFYSKCYSSGEDFPEVLAAVDTSENTEWHPMKLKHTIAHPNFDNLIFFDEIRLMLSE